MGAAADLLVRERGEPTFDEIDPGGAGRREMHMEARALGQLIPDRGRFVSAVIVQDQMDVQ